MDSVAMLASLIVPTNNIPLHHNSLSISAIPNYIPNEEYFDVKYNSRSPHVYAFPTYHQDPKLFYNYPDIEPNFLIEPPVTDKVTSLSRVCSFDSNVLSNQNSKYEDFLEIGQKLQLFSNGQEDSCNAVDHSFGGSENVSFLGTSLSFNGKINNLLMDDAQTSKIKVRNL